MVATETAGCSQSAVERGWIMYSLYRSWLTQGAVYPVHVPDPLRSPLNPLGSLSLADVVVAVGDHQFAAHRAVLAANSGYFKAALGQDAAQTCVPADGVTPEAFAPLLAYMYTGYLDIGSDNIYEVLLATHYLHMPRALELCRNFLHARPSSNPVATLDGGSAARSTLVKPIPGLPWRPALVPVAGPPRPSVPNMILHTAEHSPFRAPFLAVSPSPRSDSPACTAPTPRAGEDNKEQSSAQDLAHSVEIHTPDPCPETTMSSTSTTTTTTTTSKLQCPTPASCLSSSSTSSSSSSLVPARSTPTDAAPSTSSSSKVVIDVACCDGPVQFERVLNASYGCDDENTSAETIEQPDENQLHQRMHVPGAAQLRRARVNRLAEGAVPGEAGANAEFRCPYCNQAFKSHYCYQKHARRHLNPLPPKLSGPEATPRAPARPLDMNVQYYPCKTCGSKFPSYYFVHKHRKMCHAGEEADGAAAKTSED